MWLPESIVWLDVGWLMMLSGFTSFITAALGIGGGVLLLAVLSQILPLAALIPVHGLVQLGSSGNRAWMTRRHVDWQVVGLFLGGAVLGAVAASFVVVQLPLDLLRISVALFIIYLVWGPKPAKVSLSSTQLFAAGGLTTLLSAFVGATGPLVAAVLHRRKLSKLQTVATFATCMSFQHLLKGVVFSVVGFAFSEWLWVILLMIAAGVVGTWLGLKVLNRIPTAMFSWVFRGVVTLLALRLLYQGLT